MGGWTGWEGKEHVVDWSWTLRRLQEQMLRNPPNAGRQKGRAPNFDDGRLQPPGCSYNKRASLNLKARS